MKLKLFAFLLLITFLILPSPTAASLNQPIIINHQAAGLFAGLSDADLTNAAAQRLLLRHASVGGNILEGLTSLKSQNSKYNFPNWIFQSRGNPGWQAKIDDLVSVTNAQISNYPIFSMKFCYIDDWASWNSYRTAMETLQTNYPTKLFIWWTIPLTTTGELDQVRRNTFNNSLRSYAQSHNIIVFDIASIESHDPTGNLYQATFQSQSMDSMYPAYSSDGGHLSTEGKLRLAKSFWYLMSQISKNGSLATPTPTPTPIPPPTGGFPPGDLNHDTFVDIADYSVFVSQFFQTATGLVSDLDGSGTVDVSDYSLFVGYLISALI